MMNGETFRVAVIGLGNMGLSVLGSCALRGMSVTGIDKDLRKVEALKRREAIVPEAELEDVLKLEGLTFTTDLSAAVGADIVYIGVQTPCSAEIKECDYTVLLRLLKELNAILDEGQIVLIGSTLFPGSIKQIVAPILRKDLHLLYQPVFLRAGKGIHDYLNPGKVVMGAWDQEEIPSEATEDLRAYRCEKALDFIEALGTQKEFNVHRVVSYQEAECAKMVHNAFISMKISFANEMADLCKSWGVDAENVIRTALTEGDKGRILTLSHALPGPPYSGPCLPKDAQILQGFVSKDGGGKSECPLLHSIWESNKLRLDRLAKELSDKSGGGTIGIVGLSFRPEFNEMRDSIFWFMLNHKWLERCRMIGYDPAFAGLEESEYLLACRQNSTLAGMHESLTKSLKDVWLESAIVLINRKLTGEELAEIRGLVKPTILDLYGNF